MPSPSRSLSGPKSIGVQSEILAGARTAPDATAAKPLAASPLPSCPPGRPAATLAPTPRWPGLIVFEIACIIHV